MALKLWLPLISDNRNQGISNYIPTGSPASWGTVAPIGGCATFNNNTSQNVSVLSTDFNYINEDFSWCCWVNKNYSAITASSMWVFTVGRADAGGRGYGLKVTSSSDLQVWFGNKSYSISSINDNEWHHIAFTRSGTTLKIYRDGILLNTYTFDGTLPTYSDGNGLGIGCFHHTGYLYPLIGSVCDFRLYTHAISSKEVSEIAKALLLHIPFYGGYSGVGLNIADGTSASNSAWYAPKSFTLGTNYTRLGINSESYFGLQVGDTYTFRCKVTAPSTNRVSIRIQFYTSNDSRTSIFGNTLGKGKTGYLVLTSTLTEAQRGYDRMELLINNVDTSISPPSTDPVIISEVKLELGSIATPWSPAAHSDDGNDDFKIKDCSGYNKTIGTTGNVPIVYGGPRYDKCAKIASGNCIYPIPDPIKSTTKEFTISCWFNSSNVSNTQCIWNGRTTTGKAVAIFIVGSKLRIDDDNQTTPNDTLSSNTWYHLAVTWKSGGNKIIYLNGIAISTVAVSSTLSKSNTNASIGRSSINTLTESNYFNGMMSDFRIYGTELSATEIKAIYNNPVSISNTGELFATLLEEGQSTISHTKTGITKCTNVSELPIKYDTKLYYEPDGTCWVRIVHHNNPASYIFDNTDSFRTGVYKDTNRFFDGTICDLVDKWEFMAVQQEESTSPIYKARWIQPVNPNIAAFADVPTSVITRILTDGYVSHSYGGLYHNSGNTYWNCHSGTSASTWWGAVGAYNNYQNGIPGLKMNSSNNVVVKSGFVDLYIRIDNVIWTNSRRSICSFDRGSNGILSTEFIED